MADIQQWRRMMQPARVRTPAADLDDSDVNTSPVTPRKALKPKFSTNFAQRPAALDHDPLPSGHDRFLRRVPSWITDEPTPSPDVDQLIDSMMCNVLDDPYNMLTARYTSDLMQIFEGYRAVRDDKAELLRKLDVETQKRQALERAWKREREEYKAEVKRLELLLSKGKRGLAEVTLARQDSLLRRGRPTGAQDDTGLETILQVLEKSKRYEDKTWSSQRGKKVLKISPNSVADGCKAMMRHKSPSPKMRRLSKTLARKAFATDAELTLLYGTPPLDSASILQREDNSRPTEPRSDSESRPSLSDDTFSSFGGGGDLLPDETGGVEHNSTAAVHRNTAPNRQRHRQAIPDIVPPKLFEVPSSQRYVSAPDSYMSAAPGHPSDLMPSGPGEPVAATARLQKAPSLRTKASGFLARLRPQLNVDTSDVRRFSFESGDDADASFSAPAIDVLPPAVRDRLLRKSASMSSLEARVQKSSLLERRLTPVAQSPTTSAPSPEWLQTPSESDNPQRRSKIPTPVHQHGSLARQRRERDDSSSSLLTAIRCSEDASLRRNSRSSSAFSSPSGSRIDMTQGVHIVEIVQGSSQRTTRSNRLLEHTDSLRGRRLAVAAAKTAAMAAYAVDPNVPSDLGHHLRQRSSNNSRMHMHAGPGSEDEVIQMENHRPIG